MAGHFSATTPSCQVSSSPGADPPSQRIRCDGEGDDGQCPNSPGCNDGCFPTATTPALHPSPAATPPSSTTSSYACGAIKSESKCAAIPPSVDPPIVNQRRKSQENAAAATDETPPTPPAGTHHASSSPLWARALPSPERQPAPSKGKKRKWTSAERHEWGRKALQQSASHGDGPSHDRGWRIRGRRQSHGKRHWHTADYGYFCCPLLRCAKEAAHTGSVRILARSSLVENDKTELGNKAGEPAASEGSRNEASGGIESKGNAVASDVDAEGFPITPNALPDRDGETTEKSGPVTKAMTVTHADARGIQSEANAATSSASTAAAVVAPGVSAREGQGLLRGKGGNAKTIERKRSKFPTTPPPKTVVVTSSILPSVASKGTPSEGAGAGNESLPAESSAYSQDAIPSEGSFPAGACNRDSSNRQPVTLGTTTTIHVQPLLVLDLNGILCHRIRWTSQNRRQPRPKCTATVPDGASSSHVVPNGVPTAPPEKQQEDEDGDDDDDDNSVDETPSVSKYREPIGHAANTDIIARTDLVEFLTFLDEHFTLAVWTSAKRRTASKIVQLLFPEEIGRRLLFVWSQNWCDIRRPSPTTHEGKDTTFKGAKQGKDDNETPPCSRGTKQHGGTNIGFEGATSKNGKNSDATLRKEGNGREQTPSRCDVGVSGGDDGSISGRGGHHCPHPHHDTIFVKSLAKVWNAFPLWNPSNTLLMDDSPEKCPPQYLKNTIHPPPIQGLVQVLSPSRAASDDANASSPIGDAEDNRTVDRESKSDLSLLDDETNQRMQTAFFRSLAEFWSTERIGMSTNHSSTPDSDGKAPLTATCQRHDEDTLFSFLGRCGRGHMGWRGS